MEYVVLVSVAFGVALAFGHFLSEHIHINYSRHKTKIISFAAGISISYLFLYLFPELYSGTGSMTRLVFLFVLLGFSVIYIIEKHTCTKNTEKLKKDVKELHASSFFLYHFLFGISLVSLTGVSFLNGFLFFIPVFLHTTISSISFKELHEKLKSHTLSKIILSFSSLIGVMFALIVEIDIMLFNAILGFVVGALLYIIVRDSMPKKNHENPSYFLLGVIIYIMLLFAFFMA